MLYLETTPNTFSEWTGHAINGVLHPRNIEQLWSAADLAKVGLYAPATPAVPEGKIVTGQAVQRVNGAVTWVYTLADAPPPSADPADYPLSMRQLRLGLFMNGYAVDFLQSVISAIPDATERGMAQIWYEETSVVEWAHPMTQSLMAAAGISTADATAMWMQAKDLAA